jgi:hypothetical protein
MLGWSGRVQQIIHQLRLAELASARKFRLMLLAVVIICRLNFTPKQAINVADFSSAFVPVTVAPITIYGILASKSRMEINIPLNANRIFTILSLLY